VDAADMALLRFFFASCQLGDEPTASTSDCAPTISFAIRTPSATNRRTLVPARNFSLALFRAGDTFAAARRRPCAQRRPQS
jgi:hypothetical protein